MHPLVAVVLGLAAICLVVWLFDRLRTGTPQSLLVVVVAVLVVILVVFMLSSGHVRWSALQSCRSPECPASG